MFKSKTSLTAFSLEEAVKLIVVASRRLKCSNRTRAKALMIYHQFKRCIGEMKYDPNLLAAACISLSGKSTGEKIELDSILMTFFCMLESVRKSTLSEEFKKIKDSLIMMECIILRMIDFDLNHRLAHEYITYFLFDLNQELTAINMWHVAMELSLKIVSDFYLDNRCLNYTAEEIASSAIHAAFFMAGIDVNCSSYLKIWLKHLKETPKKLDIFDDIFKICEISPEAECKK